MKTVLFITLFFSLFSYHIGFIDFCNCISVRLYCFKMNSTLMLVNGRLNNRSEKSGAGGGNALPPGGEKSGGGNCPGGGKVRGGKSPGGEMPVSRDSSNEVGLISHANRESDTSSLLYQHLCNSVW